MKDFTTESYKNLMESLKSQGLIVCTVSDYNNKKNLTSKIVFLRHDIDKNPQNALEVALIEHEMGIHGTYYFRIHPQVFIPEVIRQIAEMDHEIGYHYEDFTKWHGNPEKAIISFQRNLETFRKIIPVKTICMDGRPLSKFNNLDLWKYYDYKSFGIDTEPYLDIDFNKVLYLTDTGRGWNLIDYSVRDKVRNPFNYHDKTTIQVINDIEDGKLPNLIMITIHPQRWTDKPFPWLRELVLQNTKNIIKRAIVKGKRNGQTKIIEY